MVYKALAIWPGLFLFALRQQMQRNKERFPEDFMFQLSEAEVELLVSQTVIPSRKYLGGALPYAFTEQGIAMLSSVLNNKMAVRVDIQIMRTFAYIRKMMLHYHRLQEKIEALERKYDGQFKVVFEAIHQLLGPSPAEKKKFGFLANKE